MLRAFRFEVHTRNIWHCVCGGSRGLQASERDETKEGLQPRRHESPGLKPLSCWIEIQGPEGPCSLRYFDLQLHILREHVKPEC